MQLRLVAAVAGLILLVLFTFVWRPPQADSQPAVVEHESAAEDLLIAPPPEEPAAPAIVLKADRLVQPAAGSTLDNEPAPLPATPAPQAGSAIKNKPRPKPAPKVGVVPRVEAGSVLNARPRGVPAPRAVPAVPEAGSAARRNARLPAMPPTVLLTTGLAAREPAALMPSTLARFIVIGPDGLQFAIGDSNGEIRLLDLGTKSVTRTIKLGSGTLLDLLYTPDGALLATATDQRLLLLDPATGDVARRYKTAETYSFMALLPDAENVIAVSQSGRVVRLSLNSGDAAEIGQHGSTVTAFALSPSGRYAATGSNDGSIRVWPLERPGTPITLPGARAGLRCLAFSPDDRRLASSGSDTAVQVRVIEHESGPFLERSFAVRQLPLGLQFSREGRQLLISSLAASADISRYDFQTSTLTSLTDKAPPTPIRDFAISSDGRVLAALTRDSSVHVFMLDPSTTSVEKQFTITTERTP